MASRYSYLLAVLFLLNGCKANSPEEIQQFGNREEIPSMTIRDLTSTITDDGAIKYRFKTPEMLQFDQRKEPIIEFPKGLHLFVYDELEKIEAQIKCKWATYYQNDELWELRNDVEAVNTDGEVINTELMYWDSKKGIIFSDQYVKITGKTEIITGYGFEAEDNLQNYTIHEVSGIIHIEDGQKN